MPQDKLPIPQFAAKIKAKYPQYKDIDDTVLVQKILAKYPEYNEQVDMAVGVKKKEPSSVGAAASTMALAGGGQVGASKSPLSGLVPTGTENEYDREMKRRQMEAEGVDYNPNDPLGSYLKVAQNKIASTRDRAASENTSSKVAKLSASVKNKEVIAEKNAIEKFRFNNVEEAKQFAYPKLDKSKLVLKDSNVDLTKAEGLENYTDESILQAAGDNFTVNKAVSQYLKNKKIKEELQSSSSISEAAIKNAIAKGDIQAKNIEQVGGEIPNEMKGDIILNYLNNPDVLEEVRKDPVLLEQYRKEIFDFPKNNPMAAIKIMAQMVSKRREDSGGNNGILNAPSQSSTDQYIDELVESGELPVQYKYLYERPEVKQAVKSSLKTSGFLENTFQSANEAVEGISNSVAQLTGAKNLYTTEEQRVFNQLQKEYGQVAFKPKGWFHDITTNGGIVTGQVLPMMVGGGVLNAAKLVNNTRAANMIMTGLQSFGYNKDRALTELPGQSGAKQLAYATLNTGIEVALSNVFDDTKLARQLMKGVSPEVKTILTKFTNKEITSAAAKEEVNNIFLKALENAPQFVKGVVGTAEKEAREEALTEILQIANNQVFGGQPIELDQAASQAFDVWRTTFLGSLPLGVGGGIVEVNKNPEMGKMVYEMATNPEKYAEIIKNNAALDEEYGADLGQKLSNLEYITKVKQDLDSREDMNQVDKEKFLITSLNQKIVADQAAQITEPTLRKEPEQAIQKLESEKEQILSNPTPLTKEQEAIKAAVDNGTLQGMNQMMAIEAIKDPSVAKSYLEMIADQSKNEVATVEGAETQGKANIDFGEDLVKMATEMFPKREPGAEDISQPIELDPTLPEGYELPEQQQQETEVNIPELKEDWSRDVESTAKALDKSNEKELKLLALKLSIKQLPDIDFEDAEANKNWIELQKRRKEIIKDNNYLREQISNVENKKKSDQVVFETLQNLPIEKSKFISEAYHKAKADGTNPELVKAVEDLLGKAPTQYTEAATPREGVEGVSGSALKDVEGKKADIERRRQEELKKPIENFKNAKNKEELIKAGQDWIGVNPYDNADSPMNVRAALLTQGGFEKGKDLFIDFFQKANEIRDKQINAKYDAELATLEETSGVSGSALKDVESTAKALDEKKKSLDEKAKKLGYVGIKQFNAQNQLNEKLSNEEKELLQEYSDFQQEVKNLKDENVISKLSDDEFSSWSKANDITRDDLGKVVKDEEIELAAKRIRILNARGDSKKADSELKKLKESKKKDNWTVESWKERFDEDIEQSEIDDINQSNKEFNNSLDKAVEELLGKPTQQQAELEQKKAELETERQQAITEATKPVVELELLGDENEAMDLILDKAKGDKDGGRAKVRQHERIRAKFQALKELIDCV